MTGHAVWRCSVHLSLHEVLELSDFFCVLWVGGDVVFIKECLKNVRMYFNYNIKKSTNQ